MALTAQQLQAQVISVTEQVESYKAQPNPSAAETDAIWTLIVALLEDVLDFLVDLLL